jgi:threonine/homoserine efflux transporter RhtA
MGLFGFTAVLGPTAVATFLGIRSYRMAQTAEQRTIAMGLVLAIVACLSLAWGDLGTHFLQYKVLVALAVAVAAGLSVATGAWPGRPGARRGREPA